jgi:hypothetical protein
VCVCVTTCVCVCVCAHLLAEILSTLPLPGVLLLLLLLLLLLPDDDHDGPAGGVVCLQASPLAAAGWLHAHCRTPRPGGRLAGGVGGV